MKKGASAESSPSLPGPLIGITMDIAQGRYRVRPFVAEMVARAGGVPLLLPPLSARAQAFAALCDGFVFTGGDDPDTRPFGEPVHPKAALIDPERQAFETVLLRLLDRDPYRSAPVLGICLGMQMMGLIAGGRLDQHLPDHLPSAADHWNDVPHAIDGAIGRGVVCSHHRQALTDAGHLQVIGRSPDGVIEAICDPDHPFRVGVQWHPERSEEGPLGNGLFERLVGAARALFERNAKAFSSSADR